MKRSIAAAAALAVFALPGGASAAPSDEDRPTPHRNAGPSGATPTPLERRSEPSTAPTRTARTPSASASRGARRPRSASVNAAKSTPRKECKKERAENGQEAFAMKYGKNENDKNAYGKCVSAQGQGQEDEADARDAAQVQGSAVRPRRTAPRSAAAWAATRSPTSTARTPTSATPSASACRRRRRPPCGLEGRTRRKRRRTPRTGSFAVYGHDAAVHSAISVRAPLRIALGGGGTDLPSHYRRHGGFVVSAAIDRHVRMRGRPAAGDAGCSSTSSARR